MQNTQTNLETPEHRNENRLPGGMAILTLDHWVSKVTETTKDARGLG